MRLYILFCFVCGSAFRTYCQIVVLGGGVAISTQSYSRFLPQPTVRGNHNLITSFIKVGYIKKVDESKSLELSLQNAEKGYDYSGIGIGSARTKYDLFYEYRLNYLEAPISFKFQKQKFGFKSGVIVSYLYKANYRYSDQSIVSQNGTTSIYRSEYFGEYPFSRFRKWDFGVLLGLTYKVYKNFSIDLNITKHFVRTDSFGPQTRYNDIMYQQYYSLGCNYYINMKE